MDIIIGHSTYMYFTATLCYYTAAFISGSDGEAFNLSSFDVLLQYYVCACLSVNKKGNLDTQREACILMK